ncbi:MAG: hypothetical protein U0176_22550 [Bacteroidia bacterium]
MITLQTNPGPYSFVWELDSLPIDGNYVVVGSNSFALNQGAATLDKAGNYRVTATNPSNGCSVTTAVFAVSVNAVPATPTITASGPLSACQGTVVNLTASGSGPFLWSDGSTTSSVAVTQSGTFTVNALGQGGCQSTSAPVVVTISPMPTANITGQSSYCVGEALHLQTPSGPYTFQWEFDDLPINGIYATMGSNSATLHQVLTSAAQSGNYRVRVTSTASGCSFTSSDIAITVNAVPAPPVITASGPTALCQGASVTLTTSSSGPILWSTGETTQSITVSQAGTFLVTAQGQGGCNSVSTPVVVTVNPVPVVSITGQTTYCTGSQLSLHTLAGAYTYQWEFDSLPIDGNYAAVGGNSADLTLLLNNTGWSGNYRGTATATGSGCTTVSQPTSVIVNASPVSPTIAASGPLTLCQGNSVTLSAPIADSYSWSSGAVTQSITVSQTGTFAVTVSNAAGCQAASGSATVTVNPLPPATVQGASTYCQGMQLSLQAPSGPYVYAWEYDSLPIDNSYVPIGGNSSSLQFPLSTTAFSGNYRVLVTNSNTGCSLQSSVFPVTVYPVPQQPEINTVGSTEFCQGDSVELIAPTGTAYSWSGGQTTQSIVLKHSGTLSVTVTTPDGCYFTAGPVTVVEHPLPSASINGLAQYCSDETILLTTFPGYHYAWEHDSPPIDGNYAAVGTNSEQLELTATVGASGNYVVTAIDSVTGCTFTSAPFALLVNQSPETPVIASNPSGTLCADVQWTLSVTNPEPGAVYTWSTGQVGTSIVALMQGSYSVVSSFPNGCSRSSNTLVLNPRPVLECMPTGCYTHCESLGPVEIAGPLGFDIYEWLQEPGQVVISNSQNLSVTQSGSYRLRVTNAFGCSATSDLFDITFIDCCSTFVATDSSTDVTCNQYGNGTGAVFASGGLEPYSYQWNTGSNSAMAQYLNPGSYSWTVTDQNNCVLDGEIFIVEPDPIEVFVTGDEVQCFGGTTDLVVTATGGTPPYVGTGIHAYSAGYQYIFVTDSNGCQANWEGLITEPDALVATATAGTIQCQGDSTVAIVSASGGVPPYSGTGSFAVSHGVHLYCHRRKPLHDHGERYRGTCLGLDRH